MSDPRLKLQFFLTLIISVILSTNEFVSAEFGDENLGNGASFYVRFRMPAGKTYDCYTQYVKPGETFLADYEVIRSVPGVTLEVGFTVASENGTELHRTLGSSQYYKDESGAGGWFDVCFHNGHDGHYDKELIFYISSFKQDEWGNYEKELTELDIKMGNFTENFSNVETLVIAMLSYLHHSRAREAGDISLSQSLLNKVSFWSLVSCLLVIGVGSLQVYFVRQLFEKDKRGSKAGASLY